MIQDTLISIGKYVMRLVHDNRLKIVVRETAEALITHQALYGPDHHTVPAPKAGFFRLFCGAA